MAGLQTGLFSQGIVGAGLARSSFFLFFSAFLCASALGFFSFSVSNIRASPEAIPDTMHFTFDGGFLATLTASAAASNAPKLPGRRYDHPFFSAITALMVVVVFVGFAHTYYLAGMLAAPLPSLIIHVHGAAFTLWMLLLVAQTTLVAVRRTGVHMRLGIAAFALGAFMVPLGVLAATDSLLRTGGHLDPFGRDPRAFYIVPLTQILLFALFLFLAFRNRLDSPAHKRYILLANTSLLVAALARWPLAFMFRQVFVDTLLSYVFLLLLVLYDLWSTRKIHRTTLWGGAFLIFVGQARIPIAHSHLWRSFADWVLSFAR